MSEFGGWAGLMTLPRWFASYAGRKHVTSTARGLVSTAAQPRVIFDGFNA